MEHVEVIKNAQLVLENGIRWDGFLVVKNGVIVQVGNMRDLDVPIGAKVIDAEGFYVGPGFVDIHVHGGGGFDTCRQVEQAAEFFLSHGETSILPTPAYNLNFEEFIEAIRAVKDGMKSAKSIKGLYIEGPFTNPDYGANGDVNPWRYEIGPEIFQAIVDEAGKFAKVWAIAPERTDVFPFLEYARKVNPEVIFAIGHSEATPMQIRALGKYKPKLQTHSLNATGRPEAAPFTRSAGPDEYCFREIDVYTELISDSYGIHVGPELQQLMIHNKGIHRVILITDSTAFDNPTPEELSHIKDLNFDSQGILCGSKMTMELACKNIMTNTNCGIAQAFIMASTTPARAIGMDHEIGSIEVGKKADFVFVDDKFNVKRVMLGGAICY